MIVALCLPACGDDDDGTQPADTSGSDAPALTKAEFIREADEICGATDDDLRSIQEEINALGTSDYGAIADLIRQIVDRVEAELEDLRALTPPKEDQEEVDEVFDFVESQLPILGELADATERQDAAGIQSTSEELARGQEQTQDFAQDYGFKECGSGD